MMRCICPEDKCTACEACVVVCPKKCIVLDGVEGKEIVR